MDGEDGIVVVVNELLLSNLNSMIQFSIECIFEYAFRA